MFGAPRPAFGNSGTSPFGQQSNNVPFGQNQSSAFGSTTNNTSTGFSGFGNNNQQQSNTSFGMSQTSNNNPFGQATSQISNPSALIGGGTTNKPFSPYTEKDATTGMNNIFQSITCISEYKNLSFEELRLQDYRANRKFGISNSNNVASSFGTSNTSNSPFSTNTQFGNTGNNMFGQTNSTSSPFGQPGSTTFGQVTNSPFGRTAQTANGFGQSNNAGSFGSTSNSASSPFGLNKPASNGLFGQCNTFGQSNNSGNSLFGQSNQPNNTFGQNTTTPFGQNNTSFRQSNNISGGGLFGQNTTTTATGGGLFGQNNNTSTNLFGQANVSSGSAFGNKSGTTGGLFNQNNTSTGTGLFGQSNQTSSFDQNTNTNGGLFGQANQQQSGGLFGQNSSSTSGGLFGQNSQQGGNSFSQPTSNTFGQTNQQSNTSLFGNKSSASGGLFGQSNNSTFGNSNQQPSGGLFGQGNQQQNFGLFGQNNQQPGGGNLFGQNNQQQQNSGLFGQNTNKPQNGGLFGQTDQQQTGGLFGAKPTGTISGGLFGQNNTAPTNNTLFGQNSNQQSSNLFNTTNNQQTQASTTGIFGTKPAGTPSSGGLFGSNNSTATTGGLFGQNNNTQSSNASNSLFGAKTTGANNSLFGTKPTSNVSGGLFNTKPSNTTNNGLFGSKTAGIQAGSLFNQSNSGTSSGITGGLFNNTQNQQPSGNIQQTPLQSTNPYGTDELFSRVIEPNLITQPVKPTATKINADFKKKTSLTSAYRLAPKSLFTPKFLPVSSKPCTTSIDGATVKPLLLTSESRHNELSSNPTHSSIFNNETDEVILSSNRLLFNPDKRSFKNLIINKKKVEKDVQLSTPEVNRITFLPDTDIQTLSNQPSIENNTAGDQVSPMKRNGAVSRSNSSSVMLTIAENNRNESLSGAVSSGDIFFTDDDYYMSPSIETLSNMTLLQLRKVQGLVVGHKDYGKIEFLEHVDLSHVPLASICGNLILFSSKTCTVNFIGKDKPQPGEGLNVRCRITTYGCYPIDKATGNPIKDPNHPVVKRHIAKLKGISSTRFDSYDPKTGSYVFTVDNPIL